MVVERDRFSFQLPEGRTVEGVVVELETGELVIRTPAELEVLPAQPEKPAAG